MDQFCRIYRNFGKRKSSTFPFPKLKFVPKAFMIWFNLTYICIPHKIYNLFLVKWSQSFQMALQYRKKSEDNISVEATYLESKFSYFFWMLQGSSLILFKVFNVFPNDVGKMKWLKMTICICQPLSRIH